MPSYFGQQTQTFTDAVNSGGILYETVATFACPGSGNQNIQELSAYIDRNAVTVSIRLGVYDSTGATLIAEGTAAQALAGAGLAWQGHMTQADVKAAGGVSPGVLVGGVSYILGLAFGSAGGSANLGYTTGGSADNYKVTDYTGGMPEPLPTPDGSAGYRSCVRCGVDPAAPPVTNIMGQICM